MWRVVSKTHRFFQIVKTCSKIVKISRVVKINRIVKTTVKSRCNDV